MCIVFDSWVRVQYHSHSNSSSVVCNPLLPLQIFFIKLPLIITAVIKIDYTFDKLRTHFSFSKVVEFQSLKFKLNLIIRAGTLIISQANGMKSHWVTMLYN